MEYKYSILFLKSMLLSSSESSKRRIFDEGLKEFPEQYVCGYQRDDNVKQLRQ